MNKNELSIPDSDAVSPTDIHPNADLSGANLHGSDISDANLSDADLSGVDLSGANLRGTDFTGANLCGADLSNADLTDACLVMSNLCGADLRGTNLTDANLSRTVLRGVSLHGTGLSNVEFSETEFVKCSNCELAFDVSKMNKALDAVFRYYCPKCDNGVIVGGNGNKVRKRLEKREEINKKVEQIAESATSVEHGTGYAYQIRELENMVSRVHTKIQEEIERRSDNDSYQGHVIHFSVAQNKKIPNENLKGQHSQTESMYEAIKYLITHHRLITQIEVPYSHPQAQKNHVINTTKHHPDGRKMGLPREISHGYYLETEQNKKTKKRIIEHLANKVGLSAEFLGDWKRK